MKIITTHKISTKIGNIDNKLLTKTLSFGLFTALYLNGTGYLNAI